MTKYPREVVAEAVARTATMSELMEALGAPATPGARAAMWARVSHYRLDTSHWSRSKGAARPAHEDSALAEAVAASVSVAEVLRRLGIRPAGGSHSHISRRIRRLGLDTSHFLGQAHRRGVHAPRRSAEDVLGVLPPGSTRTKRSLLHRCMLEMGVPYFCAACGTGPEWRGSPLTLAIDHVNGEWLDNRLENLRFLCPNCHSQTSTWCRRKSSPSLSAGL